MMDLRKVDAPKSTIARDQRSLLTSTNNVYEALHLISVRADQISVEIKEELQSKLSEFASHTESLDEVFENKEQIEVSRFYERLPKPNAIAIEEWLSNEIYIRKVEEKES
jgi:DNA-directed RNA polymerase subunit K/omega